MLTQYLEARVIRGALFRELEEGAYTAVIGFLKDEDIAVDEGAELLTGGKRSEQHERGDDHQQTVAQAPGDDAVQHGGLPVR